MDTFQNPDLVSLDSCRKDAKDMTTALSKLNYSIYNGSPLIGSALDKEFGWAKMRESIVDFFSSATPEQTLLFYFSGHGIAWANDIFLSTPQIDPYQPSARGYAFTELAKQMESCKSKRVVCIIDACHAGAMTLPNSSWKGANDHATVALATYDKIYDNDPKAGGMCLLLSSQAYQPSAADGNNNSIYTRYLVEGLKGIQFEKDDDGKNMDYTGTVDERGRITPKLLHDYAFKRVSDAKKQVPIMKANQSGDIVLAVIPDWVDDLPLEQKRTKIFELAKNGIIGDDVLEKSLQIIKNSNGLSSQEKKYYDLINRLLQNKIRIPEFYSMWFKFENDTLISPPTTDTNPVQPPPTIDTNPVQPPPTTDTNPVQPPPTTDTNPVSPEKIVDLDTLFKSGTTLMKKYASSDALRSFTDVLNLDPNRTKAPTTEDTNTMSPEKIAELDTLFKNGTALMKKYAYYDALRCFTDVLNLNSNHAKAWNNKGVCYYNLSILEESIKCFDRSLSINNKDGDVWYNKALALTMLGKTKEAEKCYSTAKKLGTI